MEILLQEASALQSFEVTIDPAAPAGHAPVFVFDLSADMNITGHGEFVEYIGQIPVLLLDWDVNHNSPAVIEQSLNNLEVGYDKMETFPADRNLYASIFVCLGTYSENHVLTAEEGQILADYLNQGGNLYMEGADTWYYDQQQPDTGSPDVQYFRPGRRQRRPCPIRRPARLYGRRDVLTV